MSHTKGQIGIEFLVLIGLLMMMFVFYIPISWSQERLITIQRENILANRIAITVKKEIDMAVTFGPGYTRNFTLPEKIIEHDYTIDIYNQSRVVWVEWPRGEAVEQIITNKVISSPKIGNNKIINQGGKIVFE